MDLYFFRGRVPPVPRLLADFLAADLRKNFLAFPITPSNAFFMPDFFPAVFLLVRFFDAFLGVFELFLDVPAFAIRPSRETEEHNFGRILTFVNAYFLCEVAKSKGQRRSWPSIFSRPHAAFFIARDASV
jgi:hypothetical protein